jgi:hypothetical protein
MDRLQLAPKKVYKNTKLTSGPVRHVKSQRIWEMRMLQILIYFPTFLSLRSHLNTVQEKCIASSILQLSAFKRNRHSSSSHFTISVVSLFVAIGLVVGYL